MLSDEEHAGPEMAVSCGVQPEMLFVHNIRVLGRGHGERHLCYGLRLGRHSISMVRWQATECRIQPYARDAVRQRQLEYDIEHISTTHLTPLLHVVALF